MCMLNVEVGHKKKIWRSLWNNVTVFLYFIAEYHANFFFLYVTIFRQTLTLKLLFFPRLLSDNVWDKLEDLRTDIHGHIHSWTPPKKKTQARRGKSRNFYGKWNLLTISGSDSTVPSLSRNFLVSFFVVFTF